MLCLSVEINAYYHELYTIIYSGAQTNNRMLNLAFLKDAPMRNNRTRDLNAAEDGNLLLVNTSLK